MSVRIVRLKNGEDIISDIYEVTSNTEGSEETDRTPVAYQLRHPYTIWLNAGMDINVVTDEEEESNIHKLSDPEVVMEPWLPLCKHDHIFFKLDEITAAYETHDQVVEKYNELVEAKINAKRETSPVEGEE
jgi:hypothetical protein